MAQRGATELARSRTMPRQRLGTPSRSQRKALSGRVPTQMATASVSNPTAPRRSSSSGRRARSLKTSWPASSRARGCTPRDLQHPQVAPPLVTVGRSQIRHAGLSAAIAVFALPSAAPKSALARLTSPCVAVCARASDSSTARSESVTTRAGEGVLMPEQYHNRHLYARRSTRTRCAGPVSVVVWMIESTELRVVPEVAFDPATGRALLSRARAL